MLRGERRWNPQAEAQKERAEITTMTSRKCMVALEHLWREMIKLQSNFCSLQYEVKSLAKSTEGKGKFRRLKSGGEAETGPLCTREVYWTEQ